MKRTAILCCAVVAMLFGACGRKPETIVLEGESLSGVSQESNYGLAAGTQWGAYDEQSYSRNRAALTRAADVSASAQIAQLAESPVWRAEVVVLNFAGGAQNVFELTVGGVTKKLTFGDPSLPTGLLRIDDLYFHGVSGDEVSVRSVAVGQTFLVVDRIRLFPEDADAPKTITSWERQIPRILGEICHNCLEAESLAPVDADPNYGVTSGSGWASYAEASYSGGRAAITRLPGAVMKGRIPNLRPGRAYRVTLAVNSVSAGENAIDLQVGEEETQRITFSGANGVVLVKNIIFESVSTDMVAVRAASIGQPHLIIDALSFEPLDTVPPPAADSPANKVDPIQTVCVGCVEAEGIGGVSQSADYGVTAGEGWGSYEQEIYSARRAALTRLPGATLTTAIPNFRRDTYDVTLTVLNDGTHDNVVSVTIGDQTREVRFGSDGPAGLRRLSPLRFEKVTSPRLTITAKSIGQPYVIIDTISIRPVG
jgi:hypothetical protein